MTDQTTALALLRDAENYLSALHGSVARHDHLAANLGCAGCDLRDRIAAELRRVADETAATETQAEPTAEEIARDHVTTLHLIGEQLSTIEGWFWEHLADVRAAEQSAAGARQDGAQR